MTAVAGRAQGTPTGDRPPGRTRVVRSGGLATLVLDNPSRRNALTTAMYTELRDHCLVLAQDPDVRLVVLRGEGGAFAAGTDVADLVDVTSAEAGIVYERHITQVLDAVRALPMTVVALVDGPAVGGGLAVVACCDLVYATRDAVFGAPVARTLGNCVSPATTARMRATLGRGLTNELLLTGRLADAAEVCAAGLVRDLVPVVEWDGLVADLLERVSRCAPLSVAAAKTFGRRLDDRAAAVEHDDVYAEVYGSADFAEGVTAFLERRPPGWAVGEGATP